MYPYNYYISCAVTRGWKCQFSTMAFLPTLVSEYPIAVGLTSFVVLVILYTLLTQLAFKHPNEPPVVFHWLPIIGSTVTYGIDPFKFFSDCQAKVRWCDFIPCLYWLPPVWQHLHIHSLGTEGDRLPWAKGEPVHSEWKAERCQCGGNILGAYDPLLWKRCHLWLSERQVYGAEKGTIAGSLPFSGPC